MMTRFGSILALALATTAHAGTLTLEWDQSDHESIHFWRIYVAAPPQVTLPPMPTLPPVWGEVSEATEKRSTFPLQPGHWWLGLRAFFVAEAGEVGSGLLGPIIVYMPETPSNVRIVLSLITEIQRNDGSGWDLLTHTTRTEEATLEGAIYRVIVKGKPE